ncbi:MAG: alpha-N-acetylglucosaminidase C-terminal domain-containing protein, partial [Victivallaceae bacterium]|nr:alpha-N-acetylglucosaminidase C-terminal domain-containing protein [Victivallaceae bacterium]
NAFVCDSSQPEIKGDYHYKRFNYFHGKKWLLSFIHLYGGDDYLAGNLALLVDDVKDIVSDKNAANLSGIYICPEIIHYNTIYFDLLANLSWNPAKVNLKDFFNKYVLRRYGKKSYENMKTATDFLLRSVYGGKDSSDALYQHRPLEGSDLKILDLLKIAKQVYTGDNAENLKKALIYALKEKDRQKWNPCYQKDIVDIMRQYISDIFNHRYLKLPLIKSDKELKETIAKLRFLMDKQEELLAAYETYQLKNKLEARKTLRNYEFLEEKAKNSMLTFAAKDWLIDYPSKVIYELIKFYYRPRMECYFQSLLQKKGNKNLLKQYQNIEKSWLKMDLLSVPESGYNSENIVDKASAIFSELNDKLPFSDKCRINNGKKDFIYSSDKNIDMERIVWEYPSSSRHGKWTKEFFKSGRLERKKDSMTIEAGENEGTVFGTDVDIPVKEFPILNFKMKSNGHLVVFWVEWADSKGKKRRNRIWQEPPSLKWRNIAINLEKVLSLIAEPVRISRIQIENTPNCKSSWEYIRFGNLEDSKHGNKNF